MEKKQRELDDMMEKLRKEYNSRWGETKYEVTEKGSYNMDNTFYKLENLKKEYLRHEVLLID